MDFFLPVAQVQVSILTILFLSFIVGLISGLFGIGGGFLMTPVLIFLGIPPAFAIANEANNILGTSVSGALTHWFRKTLDYKMGLVIVSGGILGTIVGMMIFYQLKLMGIVNEIISFSDFVKSTSTPIILNKVYVFSGDTCIKNKISKFFTFNNSFQFDHP